MIAIETVDLTKNFGALTAVDHLSLEIQEGEVFGFLGPNGAGKSTTIRMLCGILSSTSGQARVSGFDVATQRARVKELTGYMSQSFGLYNDLTVEENLLFFSNLYLDRTASRRKVEEVVESLGFGDYRSTLASHLSGGWRQRLALACAVVHDPQILFLDEPTAGIDPVSRRILWDLLYALAHKGKTLFVTTHYMEEVERCDRIGFIWKGRLVACDTPKGVRENFEGGEILNVACTPLRRGVELLKGLPGILDVSVYGGSLHILVPSAQAAQAKIVDTLTTNGIQVESLDAILPSIEDVFVSLAREIKA